MATLPFNLDVPYVWTQFGLEKFIGSEFVLVIINLAISIYFIRHAIDDKDYGEFRVFALAENKEASSN